MDKLNPPRSNEPAVWLLFGAGGAISAIFFPVLVLILVSPSNEHPGLISFRMDWLDLLAVHGTLKSLLQHHSVGGI